MFSLHPTDLSECLETLVAKVVDKVEEVLTGIYMFVHGYFCQTEMNVMNLNDACESVIHNVT